MKPHSPPIFALLLILLQTLGSSHLLPLNEANIDSLIDPVFQTEQEEGELESKIVVPKSVYNTVIRVTQNPCSEGLHRVEEGGPCVRRYSSSGPVLDEEYQLKELKRLQGGLGRRPQRNRNRHRTTTVPTTTTPMTVTTTVTTQEPVTVAVVSTMLPEIEELRPLESENKNGQKTTEVLDIEVDTPSPAFITKEAIMSVSEIRPAVEPSSYANANANANDETFPTSASVLPNTTLRPTTLSPAEPEENENASNFSASTLPSFIIPFDSTGTELADGLKDTGILIEDDANGTETMGLSATTMGTIMEIEEYPPAREELASRNVTVTGIEIGIGENVTASKFESGSHEASATETDQVPVPVHENENSQESRDTQIDKDSSMLMTTTREPELFAEDERQSEKSESVSSLQNLQFQLLNDSLVLPLMNVTEGAETESPELNTNPDPETVIATSAPATANVAETEEDQAEIPTPTLNFTDSERHDDVMTEMRSNGTTEKPETESHVEHPMPSVLNNLKRDSLVVNDFEIEIHPAAGNLKDEEDQADKLPVEEVTLPLAGKDASFTTATESVFEADHNQPENENLPVQATEDEKEIEAEDKSSSGESLIQKVLDLLHWNGESERNSTGDNFPTVTTTVSPLPSSSVASMIRFPTSEEEDELAVNGEDENISKSLEETEGFQPQSSRIRVKRPGAEGFQEGSFNFNFHSPHVMNSRQENPEVSFPDSGESRGFPGFSPSPSFFQFPSLQQQSSFFSPGLMNPNPEGPVNYRRLGENYRRFRIF